jgi:hypothetical protein
MHAGAAVTELGVALAQHLLQALFANLHPELTGARRQVRARIVFCRQALQGAGAHQLEGEIDNAFVGRQQVGVDVRHAVDQTLDLGFEQSGGNRFEHQADGCRLRAGDRVAGERQPLRPLRADVVDPHVVGQRAEIARGREAEHGIVGRDHDVTQQRDVGAACQAMTVHLRDDGLVHVEERHAQALRALELPDVVIDRARAAVRLLRARRLPCRGRGQVVAGAERPPGATQNHRVHVAVVIRLPQRFVELAQELRGKRIQLLGPVQGDARPAALDLIENGGELVHRRLLIAF